ncbi:endoribonuclease Dicer-like isoform X2 [Limulus polyphemus]|nr:endoribonuclease Dicer-like isoform X2 [Limulus polyphemus]
MENKTTGGSVSKSHHHSGANNIHTKTFTPREYQVELLESALKRNTIACLGTGTGKTFIALMLIKELAHELRKPYEEDGKRTIFLVPTVPLVIQQKDRIKEYTDLAVGFFYGEMGVDFWSAKQWESQFQEYQVLVMTAEIFRIILHHGFIPLSKVNLLIFDECHAAVKNHPYKEIMICFDTCPKENHPKVLGLTASILNGKCKPSKLEKHIQNLELNLRSTAETARDLISLSKYGTNPTENVVVCDSLEASQSSAVPNILNHTLSFLNCTDLTLREEYVDLPHPSTLPKKYLTDTVKIFYDLGLWCGQKAAEIFISELDQEIETIFSDDHRNFLIMTRTALLTVVYLCKSILSSDCMDGSKKEIDVIDSVPVTCKLRKLLEILEAFKPSSKAGDHENNIITGMPESRLVTKEKSKLADESDYLCGIIFVKQRSTAFLINLWLTEVSKAYTEYSFIKSDFVVGHGLGGTSKTTKEAFMSFRKQEETLKRFRNHDCNILIATSVIEEGMDVPKCNLVVRFDPPPDYRSYVQSKGRARAPGSHYILMVSVDKKEELLNTVQDFFKIEKLLLRKCHDREMHDEKQIADHVINEFKAPYMPVKRDGAPRITLSSAIMLVNRYCVKLPTDSFTRLAPECIIEEVVEDFTGTCMQLKSRNLYRATITLPINSLLKEPIIGDIMLTKRLAKMAAALDVCKKLHEIGELDDNFVPVGKEDKKFEELFEELEKEEVTHGLAKPGTTNRRQVYNKKTADALCNSYPTPGATCILYRFKMKLMRPIPKELNTRSRIISDPEDTTQGFGLLTTKKIPSICSFPLFTRSGELEVELEYVASNLKFSEEDLESLAIFHKYIFSDVLQLVRYPMIFKPNAENASFLIIPVNKESENESFSVDWKIVEIINKEKGVLPCKLSDDKRKKYIFNVKDYTDAVVMPCYRNFDKPKSYYVAEICHELTPLSPFPDVGYETFEEYYNKKYKIKINNLSQNLLDLDETPARLNFLIPRYLDNKGKAHNTRSDKRKKSGYKNPKQKQLLVPELCVVHPFSASLWKKAVCLPSVLYRINSLLLAEEFRLRVAQEIGVGSVDDEIKWPKLYFDWLLFKTPVTLENRIENHNIQGFEISLSPKKLSFSKLENTDLGRHEMQDFNFENKDCTHLFPSMDDIMKSSSNRIQYGFPNTFDETEGNSELYSDMEEGEISTGSLETESLSDVLEISMSQESERLEDINCFETNYSPESALYVSQNSSESLSDNWEMGDTESEEENQEYEQEDKLDIRNQETRELNLNINLLEESKNINFGELLPERVNQSLKEEDIFRVHFDENSENYPEPSPNIILQAFTMANACDGMNLERLETIGDSFLKYAVTTYLFCKYQNIHEGKLTFIRSKQISNLNLYRIGKRKGIGELMIASKFEPHDNWLSPCYTISQKQGKEFTDVEMFEEHSDNGSLEECHWKAEVNNKFNKTQTSENPTSFSPDTSDGKSYNLLTQESISDKSIADGVEALIGAYLLSCGPRATLLFMSWLGLWVLPKDEDGTSFIPKYGMFEPPKSPLLMHVPCKNEILLKLTNGFDNFEKKIGYSFKVKAYLLQAFTHASYHYNKITDCYQRLEFLGDAVLDYLITRHLFEDQKKHSPGNLTDLRSALVSNAFFASLTVKYTFHKYFKYLSPGLFSVIQKFVELKRDTAECGYYDKYYLEENECELTEEVEVPKALGDIFESVAGAIYLDSGMSLDTVWRVYYPMMKPEIEYFSTKVPKPPVRELLELGPLTVVFQPPEKTSNQRIRVQVDVAGIGSFVGVGRNKCIAKSIAAKLALRELKKIKV